MTSTAPTPRSRARRRGRHQRADRGHRAGAGRLAGAGRGPRPGPRRARRGAGHLARRLAGAARHSAWRSGSPTPSTTSPRRSATTAARSSAISRWGGSRERRGSRYGWSTAPSWCTCWPTRSPSSASDLPRPALRHRPGPRRLRARGGGGRHPQHRAGPRDRPGRATVVGSDRLARVVRGAPRRVGRDLGPRHVRRRHPRGSVAHQLVRPRLRRAVDRHARTPSSRPWRGGRPRSAPRSRPRPPNTSCAIRWRTSRHWRPTSAATSCSSGTPRTPWRRAWGEAPARRSPTPWP